MYDIVIRFLARAFVSDPGLAPSAESFAALAAAVGKSDFLPLPFEEVGPSGIHPRIGLRAADGTRIIFLRRESVDFEYHQPRDRTRRRLSLAEFCAEAGDVLARALKHVQMSAHRIAVVQEGLLTAMDNETLGAVADKLIAVPPGLPNTPPFEWDWRVAFKVERALGGNREVTNTLATVKRLSGKLSDGQAFDRIQLNTDVNTPPERTDARFDAALVRTFFASAAAWHDDLAKNVLAHCGLPNGS